MRLATLAAAMLSAGFIATAANANTFVPDPGHTEVVVAWNHAGFSIQTAKFHQVEGTLELDEGNVEAAKAEFTVAVSSVDTGVEALDGHLQGGDFFDAASYPAVTFVSTGIEMTGDKTAKITGDLTMKGVTNPVVFDVVIHNIGDHPVGQFFDYYKGTWVGLTATATIKRSEFGMGAMVPVGSDEIEITINSEMKAQ
ncbi:MAG: YceI family protein [Pseudomonadota bacterium]